MKTLRKHILITSAGIITGLLVGKYFLQSNINFSSSHPFSISWSVLSALIGMLVAYASYSISTLLDRWLPWKSHLTSRFLTGILGLFIIAYVFLASSFYLYIADYDPSAIELIFSDFIKLGILLFILSLIYNIIYFALYSFYSYSSGQIEKVKYDREQIDLQLRALKSQLSPHLLFNNLNTISSLAYKNANAAEQYIRGLAKLYRYALNSYHTKLVSLQEELAIAEAYLALIKTRYGDFLNYSITVHKELMQAKVPPLTLQMLIENAVKHNVVNAENTLKIDVYSTNNGIGIKNNLTKTPANVSSFNIGLNNIEARYKLVHHQKIKVSRTSDFNVEIPLIR